MQYEAQSMKAERAAVLASAVLAGAACIAEVLFPAVTSHLAL